MRKVYAITAVAYALVGVLTIRGAVVIGRETPAVGWMILCFSALILGCAAYAAFLAVVRGDRR